MIEPNSMISFSCNHILILVELAVVLVLIAQRQDNGLLLLELQLEVLVGGLEVAVLGLPHAQLLGVGVEQLRQLGVVGLVLIQRRGLALVEGAKHAVLVRQIGDLRLGIGQLILEGLGAQIPRGHDPLMDLAVILGGHRRVAGAGGALHAAPLLGRLAPLVDQTGRFPGAGRE